jgi:hypothetical protein
MSPTADGEDFMDEIRCGQDLLHVIVRTGWVSGRIVFSISRVTIAELHHDEELRRREFPVTGEKVFVAHAGICPIPRRVSEAIRDYAEQSTRGDQETLVPAFQMHRTRELAANLIGAEIGEVAFVGPTSLALSLVASGLSFEPGDTVLVYLDDFPSNVYPWLALAERGVEVKFLKVEKLGGIHLEDVLNQVDDRTRLVALASCHFASGFRIDVEARHLVLPRRDPDGWRLSDLDQARGFSGGRRAQVDAGAVHGGDHVCAQGATGSAASADTRLAQFAMSGFRRAG